ncbi:MAG: FecR family protein [bacterium]
MKTRKRSLMAVAVCAALSVNLCIIFTDSAEAALKAAAVVTSVKGKVEMKRADRKEFKKLRASVMLYEGDVITTGPSSQAALALTGGAEVRVNENSNFRVEPGGRGETIKLALGQIWSRMLHKKARFRVRTQTAVCAVRGTEADIEMRKLMTVKVYEGSVDLMNSSGKQSLRAGQMSQVSGPGAAPSAPRNMQSSDYGKWQDGIKVRDMNRLLESLKAASGGAAEKTMELDVKSGDQTKKLKLKLKKKQ